MIQLGKRHLKIIFKKNIVHLSKNEAESKKNRDQENDPNYLDLEANIITDDSLSFMLFIRFKL